MNRIDKSARRCARDDDGDGTDLLVTLLLARVILALADVSVCMCFMSRRYCERFTPICVFGPFVGFMTEGVYSISPLNGWGEGSGGEYALTHHI